MESEEVVKQSSLARLHELVQTGTHHQIRNLVDELKPADLADVLESSPTKQRIVLWNLFSEEQQGDIIEYVDEELVPQLLSDKSVEEIANVPEHIQSDDDLTDILQQLPATLTQQVLESMDIQDRGRVEPRLLESPLSCLSVTTFFFFSPSNM